MDAPQNLYLLLYLLPKAYQNFQNLEIDLVLEWLVEQLVVAPHPFVVLVRLEHPAVLEQLVAVGAAVAQSVLVD